jgi:hypothetical protein
MRREGSVADWGTYTSNAIIVGNTNALKDVESESFNQIKEFFGIQTDAFLVSAAMNHFGMSNTSDTPTKNCFDKNLHKSSVEEKRKWLLEQASILFDKYVSDRSNFFKNMVLHRLPIFSNPVLRVFSKYILAVMADKSDEEIQIMVLKEGFTSTSDSDNRRCEYIIWPNGMF